MKRGALALVVATAALTLAGCATERPPCPKLSANADGSYTIAKPTSKDVDGCEYEFDGQNLTTERDTDG